MPTADGGNTSARSSSADSFFAANAKFVGGIQFFSVSGEPLYAGMELEQFRRTNVNGVAYRQTGRRAAAFILTAKTDISSSFGVHNAKLAQMALQGTIIGFTNDKINKYSNYVCEEVMFPPFYRGKPNPGRITSNVGGLLPNGTAAFWMVTLFRLRYPFGF
jgi:hypothetical protein